MIEFHPVLGLFDEQWKLHYPYQLEAAPAPIVDPGVSDYVAKAGPALAPSGYEPGVQEFQPDQPCFSFNHGLGAILSAVADAGLRLESFREYAHSNGFRFGPMRDFGGNRFGPPEGFPSLPLMYSFSARK